MSPSPVIPWLAPLILLPVAVAGPNVILALYACIVLGIGASLLWRPGEPAILLAIFVYQWIQAALGLYYANLLAAPMRSLVAFEGQHDTAVFLLLTGLLVLATCIRLAAGPSSHRQKSRRSMLAARPLSFWLSIFIAASLFSFSCRFAAGLLAGLSQPLLALAEMKWAAFVVLTWATFSVPGRPKVVWIAVFLFEFALSLGGFFANFKSVFVFALIGLLSSGLVIKARAVVLATALCLCLLGIGVVWTSIKGDFRSFLNQGTGQQVTLVSYADGLGELVRLSSSLEQGELVQAAHQMTLRLTYFHFFGAAIANLSATGAHSGGEIWGEALLRTVTPRVLFPGKRAINDSEVTMYYTGLRVASHEEGTSISMGYMADAFVDFGTIFMFVPIAALGLAIGSLHRWLNSGRGVRWLVGSSLATFALMPALLLETSSLKLVPALGVSAIACWLLLRVDWERVLMGSTRPGRLRAA